VYRRCWSNGRVEECADGVGRMERLRSVQTVLVEDSEEKITLGTFELR
jgi:hypothetical protein